MKLAKATIPPIVMATTRSTVATVSRVMPASLPPCTCSCAVSWSHGANAAAKKLGNSDAYCRQACYMG